MKNKPTSSVDSLKIRIPIESIKILNPVLVDGWKKICIETAEVEENFKDYAIRHEHNGIKTKYLIETQPTGIRDLKGQAETRSYLTILVNSKMLREQYFDGITLENIRLVYDYLQSLKVAHFSLDTFLNSECSDVDIKTDYSISEQECLSILKHFANIAKPSPQANYGYKLFKRKDNLGIQFSDRKTKQYNTNPFFKIYFKRIELLYHSTEFYTAYLTEQSIEDRTRLEYTIKNKAHFRKYDIHSTKLVDILSIPQEKKQDILNSFVDIHINKQNRSQLETEEEHEIMITIDKRIILELMNMTLSNYSLEQILESCTSGIENRKTRSRKRSEINSLYSRYIEETEPTANKDTAVKKFYAMNNW